MEAVGRGRAGFSAVLRVALVVSAPVVLVLGLSTAAVALPVGRQFAPAPVHVAWNAALGDGTTQSSPVTIDAAEVALGDELPDGDQLTAGQHYFYVSLHPNYEFAGVLDPDRDAADRRHPDHGRRHGHRPGTPRRTSATTPSGTSRCPPIWDRPPSQVDGFTKVLGNERGDFIPWTFGPSTIDFVATSPLPSTPTTSVPAGPAHAHPKAGASQAGHRIDGRWARLWPRRSAPAWPVWPCSPPAAPGWCRSFADAASTGPTGRGRIMLSGPPHWWPGPPCRGQPSSVRMRQAILVKMLGALRDRGNQTDRSSPVPVLEIIVFLALNPGQTFTSVQLRERSGDSAASPSPPPPSATT